MKELKPCPFCGGDVKKIIALMMGTVMFIREDFECWTSDGEFLGNFGEELKDKLPHASH